MSCQKSETPNVTKELVWQRRRVHWRCASVVENTDVMSITRNKLGSVICQNFFWHWPQLKYEMAICIKINTKLYLLKQHLLAYIVSTGRYLDVKPAGKTIFSVKNRNFPQNKTYVNIELPKLEDSRLHYNQWKLLGIHAWQNMTMEIHC